MLNFYCEQSPYKKSWLSRAARISSPGRFSKICHGKILPSPYELRLLDLTFTKLKICTQRQLLDAVTENAERLKRPINLDDYAVGEPTNGKKKHKS